MFTIISRILLIYNLGLSLLLADSQVTYDNDQNLKTLFTSPAERRQLDQLRNSGHFLTSTPSQASSTFFKAPLKVELQGVVIRGNKQPLVFINNKAYSQDQNSDDNISIAPLTSTSKDYTVKVQANDYPFKLRPGQQWSESDLKIQEKYQIKPAKDKPDGMAEKVVSDILKETL